MDSDTITKMLTDYTVSISNFESGRDYISLSHCWLSDADLIKQFKNGFHADEKMRLKCYKGYQMEADLLKRLHDIFTSKIYLKPEIRAFSGHVKGHPDFTFDSYVGEIKSVLKDDWIPEAILPKKVYWQVQGYMKYSGACKALVIYESRESGLIKCFWIWANKEIQEQIDHKLRLVLDTLELKWKDYE